VALVNWVPQDVINPKVQRYRIFAVSDATITDAAAAGGGVAGPGGGGESKTIKAPLDRQIDLLIRRSVRDVGMLEGAANIRLIVQEAFDRQRSVRVAGVPLRLV
jgi:hypothetical protein